MTHYFPAHRGGVEIVAGEMAGRIARHATLQWLAAGCDPAPSIAGCTAEGQPAWNGIERKLGLPWPVWHPARWRRLAAAVRRAEIVHLHDFIYPSSIAAYGLARLHRKPVVITQHIGDIDYASRGLRAVLRGINRSLGRWMLGAADQVVFISPKVRAQFERHTRFQTPPLYWPNGVDTLCYAPLSATRRAALRHSLGAPGDGPVVLFVGRFVEKKGLGLMRELASRRPDWQWWFAGWGDTAALHPAHWQLPQVKVWEGRCGASLAELYQAADALVLPSYGEGYPLVIQESLACGTPVVVSADTAAGGPVDPQFIRAVPHTPAQPLPEAWITALADTLEAAAATRQQARERAATFAATEWDWDGLAARYVALFERLRARG